MTQRGNDYDGTLIAVEGIDGAGKSSVVAAIEQWAADSGEDVVTTKEPTDMWTGDVVYDALSDDETGALTDFSLFVADRARHVKKRIEPALERGAIVVTDRYADSTRAYQTPRVADQMGISDTEARDWMEAVFRPWNIEADLTIYIDIDVDTALDRCAAADKYERRAQLETTRENYLSMYDRCDASVRMLDGDKSLPAVQHKAVNAVKAQVVSNDDEHTAKTYVDAIEESED
jgi:dTMP kinase